MQFVTLESPKVKLDPLEISDASSQSSNLVPSHDVVPIHDYDVMSLEQLEAVIKQFVPAFVQVGLALRAIRDRGLFKPKYSRFEDYCRHEWGFCRQTGHRSMLAAQFALEVSPIGDTEGTVWHESQLRPLGKLPTLELRREAFSRAVQGSATKRPTAGQVNAAVADILLREKVNAVKKTADKPSVATDDAARVIHGDSAESGLIEPGSIHLVVGSPPYNIGAKYPSVDDAIKLDEYLIKIRAWLNNCYLWLVPEGGRLCLNVPIDTRKFGPFPLASEMTKIAREMGFGYEATIIWDEASHKGRWSQVDPVASPLIFCRCEAILIFSKGGLSRPTPGQMPDITRQEVEEWSSGYWRFPGAHQYDQHPCPFPPELPRRLIKLLSYPTDVVLDPWAGTGTTLLEAISLNRRTVGIEIEESYCTLIQNRLSLTRSSSTAKEDGMPAERI